MSTKTSYCNGSDMLLYVAGKAIGHCTSHVTTITTETKDVAVKPPASEAMSDGLWTEKRITGLSVSISFDGMVFYGEAEGGYKHLTKEMFKGKTIEAKCMERGQDPQPYLVGQFVIDSLERTDKAKEDSEYKGSLSNSGKVTYDENALTEAPAASE